MHPATPKSGPPPFLLKLAHRALDGEASARQAISKRVCELFNRGRFGAHLGIVAELATPELSKGRLAWDRHLTRGGDIFHGGAVMAMLDHLSGLNVMSDPRNILSSRTALTTDFGVSLMRAVPPGEDLRAEIRPLRAGRHMVFLQGDAFGAQSGVHVARARITCFLVPNESLKRREVDGGQ